MSTWRRPGDKVLTLEERLSTLERRTTLLLVTNIALVALHLPELTPLGDWLSRGAVGFAGVLHLV
jgi:hypothetical protein